MDERQLYEKSWDEQRERERQNAQSTWLASIRCRFSTSRYELLEGMLCGKHGGSLLDVGCGRGEVLYSHAQRFNKLLGIDIAENEIKQLRKELDLRALGDKVRVLACNLNASWPVESGQYNIVTCLAVLEHLFDPYFCVSEMSRALKKGGYLIIEVPNIAYVKYRVQLLFGVFPNTSGDPAGWDGGHLHYFTESSLSELVESYGFTRLESRGAGLFSGLRSVWPSLLTSDICLLFRKN